MRSHVETPTLTLHAVAGTHTVLLGWDLADPTGCLGFAIRRRETGGETVWLRGMKTFASVVPDPPPGSDWSTREHPIQGFQWGDYTTRPGRSYRYAVVALGGSAAAPKELATASVRVRTEVEDDGVHGVFFNRGVAGSQAFARRFAGYVPSRDEAEESPAMVWLSRGLGEAFVAFCEQATGAGSGLRGAFYEFTWGTGLTALAAARDRGADVALVVHGRDRDGDGGADTTSTQARAAARRHGVSNGGTIRWRDADNVSALHHHKFLVLLDGGRPVAVWTGSTNLTQGAIFGHSNVGHVIHDPVVAQQFLDEWERLETGETTAELRDAHERDNPVVEVTPPKRGASVVLAPRHTSSSVLQWFANVFDHGEVSAHITGAFGLNELFRDTLRTAKPDTVRTVLLDKWPPKEQAVPRTDPNVRISTGAHLTGGGLAQWAGESLTGFNTHVKYVHTKIILIDPFGTDPVVVTGSANYSRASTVSNEENTLVLRGGGKGPASSRAAIRRVADIYLTEYHRLFMHFVFRSWVERREMVTGARQEPGHLAEDDGWTHPYYRAASWQALQRRVFSGQEA
ncbi:MULTISPECIES: phospholipase D-like domain-containing protein [unclassified Knoellia]|uniref:phospholipase D-like domain-containing protein n=1 Tax=Knoellia altitudinis TaxID=3404795 RepID=UPI00360FCC53